VEARTPIFIGSLFSAFSPLPFVSPSVLSELHAVAKIMIKIRNPNKTPFPRNAFTSFPPYNLK
jgi:hypothetical protein